MKLLRSIYTVCLLTGLLLPVAGVSAAMAQDAPSPNDSEPPYSRRGADSCLRCHGKEDEFPTPGLFKTPHGSRTDPNSPFASAQCESCHGPGGTHERKPRGEETPPMRMFGLEAETPVLEQNGVCLGCHQDHDRLGWFGSVHEEQDVPCAGCHEIHVERDPVFDSFTQQDICFDCHPRTRAQTFQPSSHPLRFGKMACTDCHSPHSGLNDHQLVEISINDTCFNCHAEKRGPFLWEHAPAAEDCTLCHNPHGSNHPAMLSQRPPLLCQQCHMPAGHPSIAYTGETSASSFESRFLLAASCNNCHVQVHGSNHPSGVTLTR